MLPQLEHLFNAVTSFNAFPANCLCRFLEWDVFFFGTALKTESHKSCINEGRFNRVEMMIGRDKSGLRRIDGLWGLMEVEGVRRRGKEDSNGICNAGKRLGLSRAMLL